MPHLRVKLVSSIRLYPKNNSPELDRPIPYIVSNIRGMPTHKEISDTLIGLFKRRPGAFGKWMPTICWLNKMGFDDTVDNSKLRKALETCGTLMMKIEDSTHGYLHIEMIKRKLPTLAQTKWFICCSTPKEPNQCVGNFDKALYGKVLQESWDRWVDKREEDEMDHEEQASLQPTQSPQQPTPITTATPSPPQPTATTMSPSTAVSPLLQNDIDLLDLFRGIIQPECLAKENLFRTEVNSKCLRASLMEFGRNLATDGLVQHLESFYDPPKQCTGKDITKLDADPCLYGKYRIPMSLPAITEVTTAMYNLADTVPEVLHLTKHSGSKGVGKTLVAVQPSSDKTRLLPFV